MNKINDNELDALIREAEASNEKPAPEINREILRRIEKMGDKEGGRYGILKYGLVFVSGFLCAALVFWLVSVTNGKKSADKESGEITKVTEEPKESEKVINAEPTPSESVTPSETVTPVESHEKMEMPVYLVAEKYDWYNAESAKTWAKAGNIYAELTFDAAAECYSIEVDAEGRHCGSMFSKIAESDIDTDEKKKNMTAWYFYANAVDYGLMENNEDKAELLGYYNEMIGFAGDYPAYLADGIKMAVNWITEGKNLLFFPERVNIGGKDYGKQLFMVDVTDADFSEKYKDAPEGVDECVFRCKAISLFDESIQKDVIAYRLWEDSGKNKYYCYVADVSYAYGENNKAYIAE